MRVRASLIVLLVAARVHAQPRDSGFIGQERQVLEIDDCRPHAQMTEDKIRQTAKEHYERGEVLYVQGDYPGAVTELVDSYCLTPYYTMLKDIGQAYERELEYEKAIAYLERYVQAVPRDAQRTSACATDPQDDKQNVIARITVLRRLRAHILVQTVPPDAKITLSNDAGIAGLAKSGQEIEVLGGSYQLKIEHEGFHPVEREVHTEIGKPYTFFEPLQPIKGRLRIRVTPADARMFLDNSEVRVDNGIFDSEIDGGKHVITAEAPDHLRVRRELEVLPDRETALAFELPAKPDFGHRQLMIYAGFAGAVAGGTITGAQSNAGYDAIGVLAGAAAGLGGAYWGTPEDLALGTSSLTITSSLVGGGVGASVGALFTDNPNVIAPLIGGGLVVGAVSGYYVGDLRKVTPGDAAVINSGALWGTAAGLLFTLSFNDAGRTEDAGIVLSGMAMGTVGGVLLQRYFTVSRGHAALIDVSGIAGLLAGLAAEGVVNRINNTTTQRDEQTANYELGGMAAGLIVGGVLTRNLDEPKLSITPTVTRTKAADGTSATTIGLAGRF